MNNEKIFLYSALKTEIKYKDKLDFALIHATKPCICSALYTKNKLKAAPVILSKERDHNPVQAILVNSSNANACTGQDGHDNAVKLTGLVAKELGITEESVLNASTGVIGVQLPFEKMKSSIPALVKELKAENKQIFSQAIMTTDTYPKFHSVQFNSSQGEYYIEGFAKGSGMIAPDMATLLSFIVTDAPINKEDLDIIFKRAIQKSYNAITIDGDMSTNDSVFILSPILETPLTQDEDLIKFEKALLSLLEKLAIMLVKDGEGATKCVKIAVKEARTEDEARTVSKSIAESLLVKTALFGNDPNWGRIACAAGYSGVDFDPEIITITIEDITLFDRGSVQKFDKQKIEEKVKQSEYTITLDLHQGEGEFTYWTSDISYEYVKINAEYTT